MPISEIYNIDCMDFMRNLPDKSIDLAIVDPPYGINVNKMGYTQEDRKCKQKNGTRILVKTEKYKYGEWDNYPPKQEYFDELFRISKNQIIWGINYQNIALRSGRIVWDKCNGENSFSDCEIAYVSTHEKVRLFRYMWSGMCQGKSIINGHIQQGNKKLNQKRIHPTQKPVALYAWLVQNYAQPGDTILDTHLGSGSSRIAAYKLGFDFYGCEIDSEYFKASEERFKRECLNIITTPTGIELEQLTLFE